MNYRTRPRFPMYSRSTGGSVSLSICHPLLLLTYFCLVFNSLSQPGASNWPSNPPQHLADGPVGAGREVRVQTNIRKYDWACAGVPFFQFHSDRFGPELKCSAFIFMCDAEGISYSSLDALHRQIMILVFFCYLFPALSSFILCVCVTQQVDLQRMCLLLTKTNTVIRIIPCGIALYGLVNDTLCIPRHAGTSTSQAFQRKDYVR